jgi:hypothetical protein
MTLRGRAEFGAKLRRGLLHNVGGIAAIDTSIRRA